MFGKQWKAVAMATVTVVAMSACAGDEGTLDEADTGAAPQEEPATQTVADLPEGITQEQYQEGKQLFTGRAACVACHGPQGEGTQLGPDITDGEWLNIPGRNLDEIARVIKDGVPQPQEHPGPMPPMGGASLSDDQVNALAAYVYAISQS